MLGQPQPEDPRPQGNRTTSSHAESVGQPATVEPHLRRAILLHQHLGSRTARLWVNNAFGVVLGSPGRDEDTSSGAGASYFVPAVAGLRRTCRPSTQAAWSTETPAPPPASSLQPPASSLQPPASSLQPPASSLQPPSSLLSRDYGAQATLQARRQPRATTPGLRAGLLRPGRFRLFGY